MVGIEILYLDARTLKHLPKDLPYKNILQVTLIIFTLMSVLHKISKCICMYVCCY